MPVQREGQRQEEQEQQELRIAGRQRLHDHRLLSSTGRTTCPTVPTVPTRGPTIPHLPTGVKTPPPPRCSDRMSTTMRAS